MVRDWRRALQNEWEADKRRREKHREEPRRDRRDADEPLGGDSRGGKSAWPQHATFLQFLVGRRSLAARRASSVPAGVPLIRSAHACPEIPEFCLFGDLFGL